MKEAILIDGYWTVDSNKWDGFVRHPDVCQECLDMINYQDNNDESFSDADPGL